MAFQLIDQGELSIKENWAVSTLIYEPIISTDATDERYTFSLTGADKDLFTLDSLSGELRLISPANFEQKSQYSLFITAENQFGETASQSLIVNVIDLLELQDGDTLSAAMFDKTLPTEESFADGSPTDHTIPALDAITWGGFWQGDTLGATELFYTFGQGDDPFETVDTTYDWTEQEKANFRLALASYELFLNIKFIEVDPSWFSWDSDSEDWPNFIAWKTGNELGEDVLGLSDVPAYSYGEPLYIYFNADTHYWGLEGAAPGSVMFYTMVHELGHLLGLAHPFDGGNADDAINIDTGTYGSYWKWDDVKLTAMSYLGKAINPSLLDIAALQLLYGKNPDLANTGDDVYDLTSFPLSSQQQSTNLISTLYDEGGIDTLSLEGAQAGGRVNLTPVELDNYTTTSRVSGITPPGSVATISNGIFTNTFMIAEGVEIENLIGSPYNDNLRGNDLDNWIAAGDGDDFISTSGGVDTVFAGAGEDTFYVASFINATTELWLEAGNDQLMINGQGPGESVSFAFTAHGGEGFDSITVESYCSAVFDVANGELSLTNQVTDRDSEVIYFEGFERFVSTDYDDLFIGSAADEVFVSGLGADTLLAGDGNDTLISGNDDVEDILEAGEGDDILYVSREDSFTAGNGYDTLRFYDSVWVDATQNLISWDVSYAEQDGWSAPFDGEEVLLTDVENFDWFGGITSVFVGSEADDQIFDESSYSYLETGDGNDTIVGGFYSLSSVYDGGSGDDQYFVNSKYVTVYEDADNGYDVIYSSVPLYDIENQSIEEVQFARNSTQFRLIDTYAKSFEAHLGSTFLSNDLDNLIYAPLKGSTLAAGGDDVIYTYGSTSYVNAGDGDDYVIGYGSKGEFDGGAGNDIIMGGYGNEIAGGLGNDLLLAGWASTVIYTGNLSDYQFYEVYDPDFSSQLALLFVEDSSGIDAIIYDLGDGLTLRFNDQEVEQDNQIFSSYLQVSDPLLSSDVVDAWFEKPLFNLLSDAQIKGDPRSKSDLLDATFFQITAAGELEAGDFVFTTDDLPSGLTFNTETRDIEGTCTDLSYATAYEYAPIVHVTNDQQDAIDLRLYFDFKAYNTKPTLEISDSRFEDSILLSGQASELSFYTLDDDSLLLGSEYVAGANVKNYIAGLPAGLTFDSADMHLSGSLTVDELEVVDLRFKSTEEVNSDYVEKTLQLPVVDLDYALASFQKIHHKISLDSKNYNDNWLYFDDIADFDFGKVIGIRLMSESEAGAVIEYNFDELYFNTGVAQRSIGDADAYQFMLINDAEQGFIVDVDFDVLNQAPVFYDYGFLQQSCYEDSEENAFYTSAVDYDGDVLTYSYSGIAHGVIAPHDEIAGWFTYTPDENYFGLDTVTVTVSDGTDAISETISINVLPVYDYPVAYDAQYVIEQGKILEDNLPTPSDPDSSEFVYAFNGWSSSFNLNADGSFSYIPADNFYGKESFIYRVSDEQGRDSNAELVITVNEAKTTGTFSAFKEHVLDIFNNNSSDQSDGFSANTALIAQLNNAYVIDDSYSMGQII